MPDPHIVIGGLLFLLSGGLTMLYLAIRWRVISR